MHHLSIILSNSSFVSIELQEATISLSTLKISYPFHKQKKITKFGNLKVKIPLNILLIIDNSLLVL